MAISFVFVTENYDLGENHSLYKIIEIKLNSNKISLKKQDYIYKPGEELYSTETVSNTRHVI